MMTQSFAEKCKTPRGQIIIFSVIMAEMLLAIYLFVFLGYQAEEPSEERFFYNQTLSTWETVKVDPAEIQEIHNRNILRTTIFATMIDIPILGSSGIGFVYLARSKADSTWMLVKVMALTAVASFIIFVLMLEVVFISDMALGKWITSVGIVLVFSVIGTVALAFKEGF